MATGYVDVPHGDYLTWKTNTLGQAYDLDGQGCECWDYASLFWRNVGFSAGYPLTGSNHFAYECWTENKVVNAGNEFDLIENLNEILTGDIIVLDGNITNPPGHITFANEDYNGTQYLSCMGQNQGGEPDPSGGTAVTINTLYMGEFLGAFRYKGWHIPPIPRRKSTFPWVLYARKLRENNLM